MAAAGKPSKKEGKKFIPTKTSFTSPFPPPRRHAFHPEHSEGWFPWALRRKKLKYFAPGGKRKTRNLLPHRSLFSRRQLAIGVNEVTKARERNELILLPVCKSVKPKHMTDHLISPRVPSLDVAWLQGASPK
ncbi:hypothetical protein JOQ06_011237, partial [Pogonophryne albipinna]